MYSQRSDFYRNKQAVEDAKKDSPLESIMMGLALTVSFFAFMWAIGFINFLMQ